MVFLTKTIVILDLGNCAVGLQCGFARFVLISCVFGEICKGKNHDLCWTGYLWV